MSTNSNIALGDVLRLFYLGLDTATIAKVLRVSESAVYNLLAFAKSVEKNFGSGSEIIRVTAECERFVESERQGSLSFGEVSELEGERIEGNHGPDEGPIAD